jgi:hypothetical protein
MYLRQIPKLALWALVAMAGLLGFILYQGIVFHDPLAFVHAQAGWGKAPPSLDRLRRIADYGRYLTQPRAGIKDIQKGLTILARDPAKAMIQIERGLQWLVNLSMLILTVISLLYASFIVRGRGFVVVLAAWAVFVGYEWFIFSTDEAMMSTPRLLAPGIAIFIGLGLMASRVPVWLWCVVPLCLALISFVEIGFVAAGYWVI